MRVLVMVVVEDGVRLPRLPPMRLKRNARVVQDAVVEHVHADRIEHHCEKRFGYHEMWFGNEVIWLFVFHVHKSYKNVKIE